MKSFLRFVSRNWLYTAIEITGMAIALAFIILIGTYVSSESRYDTFVGNDIYVGSDSDFMCLSGTIKASVEDQYPAIISAGRMISTKYIGGVELSVKVGEDNLPQNAMAVDSVFLSMVPIPMIEGDRSRALEQSNSVIISESFASTFFQRTDLIGSQLIINVAGTQESLTITGIFKDFERTVLPETDMIYRLDLLERDYPNLTRNGNGTTVTLYKIAPGADISELEEKLLSMLKETDALYISGICNEYKLVSFKDIHYGHASKYSNPFENIVKNDTLRLFAAAGLLLLVFALLNYISLTTAQVSFRAKEMATRRLVGDSRNGIIVRYIREAFIITLVSFVLGFILAEAFSPVFSNILGKQYSPFSSFSWHTGLMWGAVIILLSVLAGIIPALLVAHYKPIDVVRGEFSRMSRTVLGKVFLVVQCMAAIGVIAFTFAMFLQLKYMLDKPMGYSREGLVDVYVQNTSNPDDFLVSELRSLPMVEDAGWIQSCPASSIRATWGLMLNGERYSVVLFNGDTTALRLLGVNVLSQNSDATPDDYYFTRRLANALAQPMDITLFEYDYGALSICGVIDDLWLGNVNSNDNALLLWSVFPTDPQGSLGNVRSLVVKVNGDTQEGVRAIKEFYEKNKPDLKVRVDSYDNFYRDTFVSESNDLKLVGIFALLTMVLTIMAMVAMSTHYSRQNAKNCAIRKIMGCGLTEIYFTSVRNFLVMVVLGAVIVVPLVYSYIGKWLGGFGYRMDNHWWIYLLATLFVAIVAVLSISYRAVQLMNTDPAKVLKKD